MDKQTKEKIRELVRDIRVTAFRAGKEGGLTNQEDCYLSSRAKEIQALLDVPGKGSENE